MRGVAALAALLIVGVCAPAPARADEPAPSSSLPLDLTWDVPTGCPEKAVVVRRVEQILLGPPPASTLVIATARIRGIAAERFELTLTMRTAEVEQTRTIEAASCAALAQVTAVVIALAFDPSTHRSPGELASDAPPPREPPPAPPRPAPLAGAAPTPPPRSPPRELAPAPQRAGLAGAVGLGLVLESGTLPKASGGLELAGALRAEGLRLGFRAAVFLRENAVFEESSGAGASFDMVQLGAFGAYMVPVGRFAFGPALNLEATLARVEGFNIRASRSTWTRWPSAVAGARAEASLLPWLGLYARADLVFPIAPPSFTLGTTGSALPLHEAALPAPRLTLGTAVLFP